MKSIFDIRAGDINEHYYEIPGTNRIFRIGRASYGMFPFWIADQADQVEAALTAEIEAEFRFAVLSPATAHAIGRRVQKLLGVI